MSPATPVVLRAVLLLVTLQVLGSCGASPGKVASVADKDGNPAGWSRPPQIDVSLVEAGAQPRLTLRYRIDPGQAEGLVVDVAMQMKLVVGDMGPPAPAPPLRVTMDVRRAMGGDRLNLEGKIIRIEVVEDPGVPAPLASAVRSDLDRLTGTTWKAVFTDRGLLELLALPAPPEANAQVLITLEWIREAVRMLLPPLPDAPVGQDARWQARRRATIATAPIDETTIYKLNGAPGSPQLQVTLGMDGREQPLSISNPPGTRWVLSSFEGGGKGQVDLQLNRIVQPTTLRWAASGKGTATPAGEPPAPFTLGLDASVTLKRR